MAIIWRYDTYHDRGSRYDTSQYIAILYCDILHFFSPKMITKNKKNKQKINKTQCVLCLFF